MHLSSQVLSVIRQKVVHHFSETADLQVRPVGGGSINETYHIETTPKSIFCKLNSATKFPQLFMKEQNGLGIIARQGTIKTPYVISCFEQDGSQVLLLDWIREGERTEAFWKKFGEQLATLHQISSNQFGLEEDNYMGSVPQSNRQHNTWTRFFIEERVQPMVRRCVEKGQLTKSHQHQFESLGKKLEDIFEEEKASLLHGDLWSGNFMCNQNNEPVLIDPAVYYGHRSIDLAMTTLFGGFSQPFYDAYHYSFPFPSNYKEQWAVCNLYPLLIHLYLFGSSYLPQIEHTLKQFT